MQWKPIDKAACGTVQTCRNILVILSNFRGKYSEPIPDDNNCVSYHLSLVVLRVEELQHQLDVTLKVHDRAHAVVVHASEQHQLVVVPEHVKCSTDTAKDHQVRTKIFLPHSRYVPTYGSTQTGLSNKVWPKVRSLEFELFHK